MGVLKQQHHGGQDFAGHDIKSKLVILAAFMALAAVVLMAQDSVPYSLYRPGTQVKRWRSNFDLTLSSMSGSDLVDYSKDVGFNRTLPIVVVGFVAFLGLLIWTCCRCCGNCRLKEASGTCKFVVVLLLLATLVAGVAMISVGLDADRQQSNALSSSTSAVKNLIGIIDEIGETLNSIRGVAEDFRDNIDAIEDADPDNFVIEQQTIDDMRAVVTEIENNAEAIDNDVNDVNLDEFDEFTDRMQDFDDKRHLGMVIILAVLLTLVLLEGIFALLNAFASEGCKPKRNCMRFFTPIVGILTIIILLVLWILAGMLVLLMTASADICYDPNAQFSSLLTSDSVSSDIQNLTTFFIGCGDDATLTNPLDSEIDAIDSELQNLITLVVDAREALQNSSGCGGNATLCDNLDQALNSTESTLQTFRTVVGFGSRDSRGQFTEGFLKFAGCYGLNERYHTLLRAFCGDGAEALGKSTEVILGFAVIYVFTQILIRVVTDTGLDEDSNQSVLKKCGGKCAGRVVPEECLAAKVLANVAVEVALEEVANVAVEEANVALEEVANVAVEEAS
eukprot:gene6503-312_t